MHLPGGDGQDSMSGLLDTYEWSTVSFQLESDAGFATLSPEEPIYRYYVFASQEDFVFKTDLTLCPLHAQSEGTTDYHCMDLQ